MPLTFAYPSLPPEAYHLLMAREGERQVVDQGYTMDDVSRAQAHIYEGVAIDDADVAERAFKAFRIFGDAPIGIISHEDINRLETLGKIGGWLKLLIDAKAIGEN